MSTDDLTTTTLVLVPGILALFVLLGLVTRRILVRRLEKSRALQMGRARDILLGEMSGAILAWAVVAGLYAATKILPLDAGLEQVVGRLLLALAIVAATLAAAQSAGAYVSHFALKNQRLPGTTSILTNLAKLGVGLVGLLVTLQTVGVSVTPILGALGIGGLAVALALQDTLSNLFAGLQVIASKKVVPGDYVQLDSGEEGFVVDVNWRNTTLRTLRNNVNVVPNARLAAAVLTNFHQSSSHMTILVPVGVAYDSDLQLVERITQEVAQEVMQEVKGGLSDRELLIRYHTFGDFSVDFNVILRVKEHGAQFLVRHEFVKRLHERYREEGIEIPFPIRTVIPGDDSSNNPPGESERWD